MIRKVVLLSAIALTLPGCFYAKTSQAPIAKTYPLTEQHKMQAAHHWQVLADYEAKGILHQLKGQSVYIKEKMADDSTSFDSTFRELLISELVSDGASVMVTPNAMAEVSFDVNVIQHKDRGPIRHPEGSLTALTLGVALVNNAVNNWSDPEVVAFPAAVVGDVFSGNIVSEEDHEIAITTRVTQNGKLLHSSTNLYYINPGDADHYKKEKEEPKTRTVRVTGQ